MKIPSIKEDRLKTILKILECIDEYKFDRDKMKECVLKIYPNKSEKSVFRGIAIPTLRHLGLIVGYDEYIRPSANGRLLIESSKYGNRLHQKVIKTVFLEIDKNLFGFMDNLKKVESGIMDYKHFCKNIEGGEEYKRRWLKILDKCGLIKITGGTRWKDRKLFLVKEALTCAESNLDHRKKKKFFKNYLFRVYKELSPKSIGIVDIEDLRGEVALRVLKEKKEIITEKQFDYLLREIPLVTNSYIISLGQPMGAEEKLFELNGRYYRTISIHFFNSKEVIR